MAKHKEQWFCVVRDESGHDYVIPAERRAEWYDGDWWNDSVEPPAWAHRLSGSGLQFQMWREHYD